MKTLILALLLNDDDGEMAEMTDCIEKKQRSDYAGAGIARLDCRIGDLDQLAIDGTFEEMLVTGHSRCLAGDTLRPLDMKDRKVGGYQVADVSKLVIKAIFSNKIKDISFWCCEAALSSRTRNQNNGGRDWKTIFFDRKKYDQLTAALDADISIVERIACDVWEELEKRKFMEPIFLKGFNGVGDVKKDGTMKTFDQQHLPLYNQLSALKNELKDAKKDKATKLEVKIAQLEEQIDKVVSQKKSAHLLGYKLHYSPAAM